MTFIIGFIFVVLIIVSPVFRCALAHPVKTVKNACCDAFRYLKYKQWHNAPIKGELICYTGLFGGGKTLSAVHRLCGIYNQYNDKKVWDFKKNRWVTQKIFILSNVDFTGIPYTRLESLRQVVEYPKMFRQMDIHEDTLTVTYVLMDEASSQMNSRSFKTNIDPLFLNSLLTSRHWNIGEFITTSQRFHLEDALLRSVTQTVINCRKLWRFQRVDTYDAWSLENATNIELVEPLHRGCWFICNKDFAAYDTKACVDNLEHSSTSGDMMSESEILTLLNPNPDADTVVKYSRKAKHRRPTRKG